MYTKSLVMHTFIIQIQDDDTTKNIVEIPINTSSHTSSFLFPCNTMYMYVMYVCVCVGAQTGVSCVVCLSALRFSNSTRDIVPTIDATIDRAHCHVERVDCH